MRWECGIKRRKENKMKKKFILFLKQNPAYEMRISDWSSDVCSSDLPMPVVRRRSGARDRHARHFRRFQLVFSALRVGAFGQAFRSGGDSPLAARRSIYRRHRACDPPPALRALLDALAIGRACGREKVGQYV